MTKISEKYKKDAFDEEFLSKFNTSLNELEIEYTASQKPSGLPVVFICGAPRSGTTFLTQALAKTGHFNYVDNFVARFWRAPFVGFYLEKLLDLRNMFEHVGYTFNSHFGRTPGILDPHEFTYFWEHWLRPIVTHHVIPISHVEEIDTKGLTDEMYAMLNIHKKPMFFKNIWFLSNPRLAYKLFPNAFIIYIKRNPLLNALSILFARETYHGNEYEWFSVRPANYEEQKLKSVEEQIVGQIYAINNEIQIQTGSFPERTIPKTIMMILEKLNLEKIDDEKIRQELPKRIFCEHKKYPPAVIKRFEKVL
jgi:hypothetical protein